MRRNRLRSLARGEYRMSAGSPGRAPGQCAVSWYAVCGVMVSGEVSNVVPSVSEISSGLYGTRV